jgi:hypothetical protein
VNFTAIQNELVEAIGSIVPNAVKVLVSEDLAAVEERSQYTPSVHVVYSGYRIKNSTSNGKAVQIIYTFDVVACTRSARGAGQTTDAAIKAGELCELVAKNLMGRSLASARSNSLQLVQAPNPVYSAGFIYLPLSFEIEAYFSAT